MGTGRTRRPLCALVLLVGALVSPSLQAQKLFPFIFPEERTMQVRDPADLRDVPIPDVPPPPTVTDPPPHNLPERPISLDEAIRITLANSDAIRVLGGVGATTSGRTIYDVAIQNNAIDEAHGRFDPSLTVDNGWNRFEAPGVGPAPAPAPPGTSAITGGRVDNYSMRMGLSKTTTLGGTLNMGVTATPTRTEPATVPPNPLNPRTPYSTDLSYTQPLLQGGGLRANLAPIVLARINTERSYFQFKDIIQEQVRGVVQIYWNVVLARTNIWALEQQLEQISWALERAEARMRAGEVDIREVAQARVAYNNFRASLVTARANLLLQEAAMRNLLGYSPSDAETLIPITPPQTNRIDFDWYQLLQVAQRQRPDLIELKLVLEADEQTLLQARNQAQPRVDAVALYRWNGLDGEMPIGQPLSTRPGQFTDWTLAVNFSVPLGLRAGRAGLRRQELNIARDEVNLQQGVHNVTHILAANMRNLAQFYEQYEAFRDVRAAARQNLEAQMGRYGVGSSLLLNVLQAIADWGNAVSSEAQSLLLYNTELANLERQTGTILESHGITFYEERFGSISPLGRLYHGSAYYPATLRPSGNDDRYPVSDMPSEEVFELEAPEIIRPDPNRPLIQPLPPPGEVPTAP